MGESAVNCTIAVDTMGGDKGPTEFIRGLFYAIEELKLECNFVLVGNKRLIERLLTVGIQYLGLWWGCHREAAVA